MKSITAILLFAILAVANAAELAPKVDPYTGIFYSLPVENHLTNVAETVAQRVSATNAAGVSTFNGRTGAVTLTSNDVASVYTSASPLSYTPQPSNANLTLWSGVVPLSYVGTWTANASNANYALDSYHSAVSDVALLAITITNNVTYATNAGTAQTASTATNAATATLALGGANGVYGGVPITNCTITMPVGYSQIKFPASGGLYAPSGQFLLIDGDTIELRNRAGTIIGYFTTTSSYFTSPVALNSGMNVTGNATLSGTLTPTNGVILPPKTTGPTWAQVGTSNTIVLWSSNSIPPTLYASYFDVASNRVDAVK